MIVIKNLTKMYGTHSALKGVSFAVNKGDIFGFIGPNGAGKTTTIRILATLLEPTTGTVYVDGVSVLAEPLRVRRLIGYMPDIFDVYPTLTVEEYLDFFAALYGFSRKDRKPILEQILELTDLKTVRDKLAGSLSKGMKQRLCMAKTLVHDPKVLILDEPAANLDPRARIEFRALLKELQQMGKTILISSHILTELSEICNSVAIIEKGRILRWGNIETILDHMGPVKKIKIDVLDKVAEAQQALSFFPEIKGCDVENHSLRIKFEGPPSQLANVIKSLVQKDVPIVSVHEEKTDLEELFMRLTRGEVS
jgi:ABC-2 type transport system ATP-binding protein